MPVKDNHPLLHTKIARFFASPSLFEASFAKATTIVKRRGRVETRSITVSDDVPRGYTGFPGVRQLYKLERRVLVKRTGKESVEVVYGMTSLAKAWYSAAALLSLLRSHWTIETRVHYVRDVTMGEDASSVRCGSLPQVLVGIRNIVIGLLRLAGHSNIAAARRYYAAHPQEAVRMVVTARIHRTE